MLANHKTRGRRGRQKMQCETREYRRYRGISQERGGKDGAYVGRQGDHDGIAESNKLVLTRS